MKLERHYDFMVLGSKATNYRDPLVVEKIKDYKNVLTVYTKQIDEYCLSFEKESFFKAVENYNNNKE